MNFIQTIEIKHWQSQINVYTMWQEEITRIYIDIIISLLLDTEMNSCNTQLKQCEDEGMKETIRRGGGGEEGGRGGGGRRK